VERPRIQHWHKGPRPTTTGTKKNENKGPVPQTAAIFKNRGDNQRYLQEDQCARDRETSSRNSQRVTENEEMDLGER
jgi:hypothetical protein